MSKVRAVARIVLAAVLGVGSLGCQKLAARVEFKKANAEYKNESYRAAIEGYQKGLALDPGARQVWRSLGLAAMASYRPGDSDPVNLAFANLAVDAFRKYLAAYPDDDQVRDYLLTTLLNSEHFDDALTELHSALREHPDEPKLEEGIVTVLLRAKRFEAASAEVQRLGSRATFDMNYGVGVAAWDRAYHDPSLDPEARGQIVGAGLEVLRRALAQQPLSFDANVYYGLMLREQAKLEPDPVKQQAIYAEAVQYQEKAKAISVAAKKNAG